MSQTSEPLVCSSPIPLIGRAGSATKSAVEKTRRWLPQLVATTAWSSPAFKVIYSNLCSPVNDGTTFPMADKPGICTDIDKEANAINKSDVMLNSFKSEGLTRSEARKLSPGQLFIFVQSPSLMCPPTNETGGHNIGTITLSPGNKRSEGYRSASTGTPVAIVRPWESYAVESWRVPPWHPPSVRTSRFMHVDADNNFQVGQRTCKSANLKIIGSRECSIVGNLKSKAGPQQPNKRERPIHDDI